MNQGVHLPPELRFLVWSNEHQAWWKPGGFGYTKAVPAAGRFTWSEAVNHITSGAMNGRLEMADVMIVAPPDPEPTVDIDDD